MAAPLRVGVIGVGYLGRFHAEKYAHLKETELVGVADLNEALAQEVGRALGAEAYSDYRALLPEVSAVSVAVPTSRHYAVVRDALEAGCQVLVEKPLSVTVAEADSLVRLARERSRILMVGHLERFNSAMEELKTRAGAPRFIESHRLAFFKERGTDVDVVLDLMIHDLDHVLSLCRAPVKEIRAAGISVLTDRIDLANARLELFPEQVRVLGEPFDEDRAGTVQSGGHVRDATVSVHEVSRLEEGIVVRVGEEQVGQRLQARLAGDLGPSTAFRLVGQVQVLQPRLRVGGADLALEFVGQLALAADLGQDRVPALVEFAQVTQALLERAQLRVVERAGGFFAVPGDERHGGAAVEQLHGGADLPDGHA